MEHVARAIDGRRWQQDQSALAKRCGNCVKGGMPCALHLVANCAMWNSSRRYPFEIQRPKHGH
jgi:hypothetical protein